MNYPKEQLQNEIFDTSFISDNGCWVWLGSKYKDGYGRMSCAPYIRRAAHRVSYEVFKGPIPDGLQLDHLCRNHACVNPAHLEAVTQTVNVRRGISPTANNARKTHCIHGHELTPENTRMKKVETGCGINRQCRKCDAIAQKIKRDSKKMEAVT